MGPEQFGEKLRVKRKPNELRLLIQPRQIRLKPGVWPALIALIVLMIGIGIALWFWMGPPFSFAGSVGQSDTDWQTYVWLIWTLVLVALLIPPAAVFTISTRRKVTLHTSQDASIRVQIKQPYIRKDVLLQRSDIQDLRLQTQGDESLPSRETNTVLYGLAQWWLRFETPRDGAFAINVPVDEEYIERFAGLIGDAFGQECRVVEIVEETSISRTPPTEG